eukprot:GHVU01133759.1.p1 GENE.GHVU01133759.1~~GHVU01133759.1.p1  ORF type:complete len:148 (+),score=26.91 GHVU01133759.1:211-654(+)
MRRAARLGLLLRPFAAPVWGRSTTTAGGRAAAIMAAEQERAKGEVQSAIERKLTEGFQPTKLELVNESADHAGHKGIARRDQFAHGETHFRLFIEADAFKGLSPLERHRLIYRVLSEELDSKIHALTIQAVAPPASADRGDAEADSV